MFRTIVISCLSWLLITAFSQMIISRNPSGYQLCRLGLDVALLTSRSIFKEFPEGQLFWLADKPTLSPPHNGLVVVYRKDQQHVSHYASMAVGQIIESNIERGMDWLTGILMI